MLSLSQQIKKPIIFKASSTGNGIVTFNPGTIAPFDKLIFCYPDASSFNTTTYSYTVPKNGIYQFSYRLYCNTTPPTITKMAISKNNIDVFVAGNVAANVEALTTLESCVIGDVINVRCVVGTNITFWFHSIHCSFSGQLIYEI